MEIITQTPRPPPENERDEQWVLNMRRNLCPAEMIDADGNFDSMYFKPRNAENLVLGNGEDSLLKEGIGLYGICHWSEIRGSCCQNGMRWSYVLKLAVS